MISPNLKENIDIPLYRQLYNFIRKEIRNNNLKYKDRLPSKRNLANHLNVSINTVTKAYEMLLDEGYIYSEQRIGYYISNIENLLKIEKDEIRPERFDINKKYKYNFKINNIDNSVFPFYTFKKISGKIISGNHIELLQERNPQGLFELRKSIKNYIYNARGVKTEERNIIVSSGIEYLLQILFYILPEKSKFAVENPGYKVQSEMFKINNIPFEKVNVDSSGMIYSQMEKSDANIVFLTPSHQFPTGAVMPINRRVKFLNWAEKNDLNYIIEDDYDSEFRYKNKPIPALKSLDIQDNVIYMGNFSKSISPVLRISYMVLPEKLLKNYFEIMPFINCPVSNAVQLSLSKFIDEGYFERHLNKMRNIYSKKREIAINMFKDEKYMNVIDSNAGMHFIIEINSKKDEQIIINRLKEKSIFVQGLSEYYYGKDINKKVRIIIGYGGIENNLLKEGLRILIDTINSLI